MLAKLAKILLFAKCKCTAGKFRRHLPVGTTNGSRVIYVLVIERNIHFDIIENDRDSEETLIYKWKTWAGLGAQVIFVRVMTVLLYRY